MSGAAVLSLLRGGPAGARRALADGVAGLRAGRMQLGSDGATLLVTDGADVEWVLRWPTCGEPTSWRWPHDPGLAILAEQPVGRGLLDDASWRPAVPAGVVSRVRRVGYKPGRRATFRLDVGSDPYLLKLVCAGDFAAAVTSSRFAGGLPPGLGAPRLQAHSARLGAVLLPYLPGTPVSELSEAARRAALRDVPRMLSALHSHDPGLGGSGLPPWDATHPVRKLQALAAAVRDTDPAMADAAASVVAGLHRRLTSWSGPDVPVHGDLSMRNLVWGEAGDGSTRLGVIDWDRAALGPVEVDLSPLVGLLGDDADGLVTAYERVRGRPVDRDLLDALVHTNRLTRTLRRVASGREPRVTASG